MKRYLTYVWWAVEMFLLAELISMIVACIIAGFAVFIVVAYVVTCKAFPNVVTTPIKDYKVFYLNSAVRFIMYAIGLLISWRFF